MINQKHLAGILSTPAFTLLLAGNLWSAISKKADTRCLSAFPVIAISGAPGSGKTSAFKAFTPRRKNISVNFYDDRDVVLECLKGDSDEFAFVDDFAKLTTDNGRRKQQATLDLIVRMAYNGEFGTLGITIETEALQYLAASCKDRLLLLDIGAGLHDPKFAALLSVLQKESFLLDLLSNFENFISHRQFNVMSALEDYRTKNADKGHTPRSIDKVFTIHFALQNFLLFLEKQGVDGASYISIDDFCLSLLDQQKQQTAAGSATLIENGVQDFLHSEILAVQRCMPRQECAYHLKKGCPHRCSTCELECSTNLDVQPWKMAIPPQDLFLEADHGANAILLHELKYFPYLKRRFPLPPMLFINADLLSSCINQSIADRCRKENRSTFYLDDIELRKRLLQINRIAVMSEDGKKYRYTFSGRTVVNDVVLPSRMVILFLREEEADWLAENRAVDNVMAHHRRLNYTPDCTRFLYTLSNEMARLCVSTAPIGTFMPPMKL